MRTISNRLFWFSKSLFTASNKLSKLINQNDCLTVGALFSKGESDFLEVSILRLDYYQDVFSASNSKAIEFNQ